MENNGKLRVSPELLIVIVSNAIIVGVAWGMTTAKLSSIERRMTIYEVVLDSKVILRDEANVIIEESKKDRLYLHSQDERIWNAIEDLRKRVGNR